MAGMDEGCPPGQRRQLTDPPAPRPNLHGRKRRDVVRALSHIELRIHRTGLAGDRTRAAYEAAALVRGQRNSIRFICTVLCAPLFAEATPRSRDGAETRVSESS